jgi:putative salt-induced outer membrane protein YdiY
LSDWKTILLRFKNKLKGGCVMKNLCFFTVIFFFTMTACLHSFASSLPEADVPSLSENNLQTSPEAEIEVEPSTETDAQDLLETDAQDLSETDEQSLPKADVQSLPETVALPMQAESQPVNQNEKRDLINELKEIITENQQYKEFFQELDQTLKEFRRKTGCVQNKSDADMASEAGSTPASRPQGLGRWWLRNALTFDPMPSQLLYHLETSYSFSRMTGNTTLDKHLIKTLLITRYNRFTSYLNYAFDKRNSAIANDINYNTKQVEEKNSHIRKSTKHLITEDLRCAILKQLYASVGFMYEEDDFVSLDKRITGYIGFGARPIQTDRFTIKFFAALGHEETDYTEDYHDLAAYFTEEELSVILPDYDTDTVKSDIFHCDLSSNWSITDNISVHEAFMIFVDTNDSDKYRWTLDLGLEYQFTEHFSLMLNYNESFDKAMNPLMGRKRDIGKDISIKVVF